MIYEVHLFANRARSTETGYRQWCEVWDDNEQWDSPVKFLGMWTRTRNQEFEDIYHVQNLPVEAESPVEAVAKFIQWQQNGKPQEWLLDASPYQLLEVAARNVFEYMSLLTRHELEEGLDSGHINRFYSELRKIDIALKAIEKARQPHEP